MGILITKTSVRENLGEALEEGNLSDIINKIKKELDLLENIPLHIAITGGAGSGKSSLVNALREFPDYGDGAAETDVVECTMEPKAYPHHHFSRVTFWDLPGIGTINFKADKYLKQIDFSRYDFFILVTCDRFSENDIKLACEIKKKKKEFYFVRTKIDISIDSGRRKPNFNEAETLQKIRNNCMENLKGTGIDSAKVFLISRFEMNKYDFPLLQKTLDEDLANYKRLVWLCQLSL